ncbi:MAG: hypothetical protein ACYC91_12055 [Solirubrobacteraceae bacterium]
MGPFDLLPGAIRSLLGPSERAGLDVAHHSPLGEALVMEDKLSEAVAAIHRAAESMERHVAVVETLADSVPALTASVSRLTDELGGLLRVLAPVAGAEQELSRFEHLFRRNRTAEEPPPPVS